MTSSYSLFSKAHQGNDFTDMANFGSSDQNPSEKGKATDFHETPISGHMLQTSCAGTGKHLQLHNNNLWFLRRSM
jgi:hypothetical protein